MSIGNLSDRFDAPGTAIPDGALSHAAVRVPGLDTMLMVAVVLACLVGAPLLEMVGVSYVRPGGSLVEKLHPSTYLIIAALIRLLIGKGDVVAFVVRSWPERKIEFLFLATLCAVAILGVLRHGTGGLAYLIDAFITPVLLAILLGEVSANTRARLFRTALLLLTLNSAVGIIEATTHKSLIGFLQWAGEEFRASAFRGHPLENALATVPVVIVSFSLVASGRGYLPTLILGCLALLAFGGRAAAVFVALAIGALILIDTGRRLANRTLSVNRLVFYLIIVLAGPAAIAVVLATTGLGERIVSHFFLDTSAQVRIESLAIFRYISNSQLWYGVDNDAMANLMQSLTHIGVIENFWIALIVNLGIYSVVILLAGFIPYLLKLMRQGDVYVALAVLTFMLVASTSNSLATKTTTLTLLTVLAIGYRDHMGQRQVLQAGPTEEKEEEDAVTG